MRVQKLRIHAILQRRLEIELERIEQIRKSRMKPFEPEPIPIVPQIRKVDVSYLYDKNGKLFDPPKSKYHK